MKIITLVTLCLYLWVTIANANKSHDHHGHLSKSGQDESHKGEHTDIQAVTKDETDLETHNHASEPTETKHTGTGRKHGHRNNHHGKNKKVGNTEAHTSRSRKPQTKPNKHNGQRSHNNKHHARKHGRGKQAQ